MFGENFEVEEASARWRVGEQSEGPSQPTSDVGVHATFGCIVTALWSQLVSRHGSPSELYGHERV